MIPDYLKGALAEAYSKPGVGVYALIAKPNTITFQGTFNITLFDKILLDRNQGFYLSWDFFGKGGAKWDAGTYAMANGLSRGFNVSFPTVSVGQYSGFRSVSGASAAIGGGFKMIGGELSFQATPESSASMLDFLKSYNGWSVSFTPVGPPVSLYGTLRASSAVSFRDNYKNKKCQ
jgi:hypothetical protein